MNSNELVMDSFLLSFILAILAYAYVAALIALATQLKRTRRISGPVARKVVHMGVGILVIFAPLLFESNLFPMIIGVSFIFITYFTSPRSPIEKMKVSAFADGHGFGTVYYSLSLTTLLVFFFDTPWILQAGFMPLVFGDASANLAGLKWGTHHWSFQPNKSVEGSIAAFLSTFFILMGVLLGYSLLDLFVGSFPTILLLSLCIALATMLTELVSPRGLDNLTIPIICTMIALVVHELTSNFTTIPL